MCLGYNGDMIRNYGWMRDEDRVKSSTQREKHVRETL